MPTGLIAIRELGSAGDDDLYPAVDDAGSVRLAAGEELIWTSEVEVAAYAKSVGSNGKLKEAWVLPTRARVVLTNQRIAYSCLKFDKGSTYLGGAVVGGAVATAVSKARAAGRRRGKAAVGQVRYQWPTSVIVDKPRGMLRSTRDVEFTCQDEDEIIRLAFKVPTEDAHSLASRAVQAFARARMHLRTDLDSEAEQTLERLAEGPTPEALDGGRSWYKLPGAMKVGYLS